MMHVDALKPGVLPNHRSMNPDDKYKNAQTGIDQAYRYEREVMDRGSGKIGLWMYPFNHFM